MIIVMNASDEKQHALRKCMKWSGACFVDYHDGWDPEPSYYVFYDENANQEVVRFIVNAL